MKSSADFIKASPRLKPMMVQDGYVYLSEQFIKLSTEVNVLNTWISIMPALIETGKCDVMEVKKLAALIEQIESAHDQLAEQFVVHVEAISKLTKFLAKNKFV